MYLEEEELMPDELKDEELVQLIRQRYTPIQKKKKSKEITLK